MDNSIFDIIPKYEGDYLEYDCANGAYGRYFANQTEKAFDDYRADIEKSGYELFQKNIIDNNKYYTYTGNGIVLHIYYIDCEKMVRITADSNTTLFSTEKENCENNCKTVVYQFETDHSLIDCGMCFIIQCCDGSYFIIDSAHFYQVNDNVRIYNFLKEHAPDGKIVINGWFFSHAHDDHISKFMDFLRYNMDGVVLEKLYYNFPVFTQKDSSNWSDTDKHVMAEFDNLIAAHTELNIVKLHSGQSFWCRNLNFQVLCTHEDVFPQSFKNFNETSTVLMMEANGTKVFFPGDAGDEESNIMTTRFTAETLSADIVQVAHHGHFGTSSEFYRMVNSPTICFPNTQIKHDEEMSNYEANRVAHELSKECFISSNGTVGFELPYTVGNAIVFPDETFENFDRIKELWGYTYTQEFKENLKQQFIANGGDPMKVVGM